MLARSHSCLKTFAIIIFQTYLTWMDNVTYCEVTKPRYGSAYPWPLNHILTWQKKQQAYKRLSALGWTSKNLEEVRLQYIDTRKYPLSGYLLDTRWQGYRFFDLMEFEVDLSQRPS